MDLSNGQMESPSNVRNIAGPSRNRLQARQHRNSSSKPYNRSDLVSDSPARRHQADSTTSSPNTSFKSAKSRLAGKGIGDHALGGGSNGASGLLSGLREAIFSRPLSWIQGAATKASSVSLPSHAQITAAQRLAASVMGSQSRNDIESQAGTSTVEKEPPPRLSSTLTPARTSSRPGPSRLATPSTNTLAPSLSPAHSATSAAIHSLGRQRLSVGPSPASPIFGGSMLGTPGYRRGTSLRPEEGSSLRGGTSMAASQSNPSYAFGFGSERRIAGLNATTSAYNFSMPSPTSASTSHNRLPSKSPFAMGRQHHGASSATDSALGFDRSPGVSGMRALASPTRSRPASVVGGDAFSYKGGSIAGSRTSNASLTPRKREWSTLKLAPPRVDRSEGEEMMQAYQTGRNLGKASHSALLEGDMTASDVLMMEHGAGPSPISRMDLLQDTTSLKRAASMSLDGDDFMSEGTPRKRARQMVWDADFGFVSKEDLRARRPPPPAAQNEAEKLLNALEGMRAPLRGTGTDRGTPLRQSTTVSVPLAVSERGGKGTSVRQGRVNDISKIVSPYSRALKQQRDMSKAHDMERGESLSARLKRHAPRGDVESSRSEIEDGDADERGSNVSMQEGESESVGASEEEEEETEEEEQIIEPPRRKIGIGENAAESSRVLRSGKVLPPSPAKKTDSSMPTEITSPQQSEKGVKPMSRARLEISASATSAANRDRLFNREDSASTAGSSRTSNGFKVLPDMPAERSKSSLRQGADKMHRTHAKSGRVGIDDEDEEDDDEDLPSAEELKKIKLPTNLFPQGFIFSGSTSPSSNGSMTPAREPLASLSENPIPKALPAPSDDPDKHSLAGKSDESNAGSSLFDRLGGFAQGDSQQASQQPSSEISKSALPTFSFTAPSISSTSTASDSAAPSTTPAFTFTPAAPKVSAGPSDFFSAPSSAGNTGTTPSPSAKNDGSVPNSFASSLAKSTSDQGGGKASTPFTFGQPASSKSDTEKPLSPAPIFSFGNAAPGANTSLQNQTSSSNALGASHAQEPASKPAASTSFTFGSTTSSSNGTDATPAFTSFGQKSAEATSEQKQGLSSFGGFGTTATSPSTETASKPAPTLSFAAPAASTSTPSPFGGFGETSKKRSAEEDEDRPGKKANGTTSSSTLFNFGSSAASGAPASTSSGFNFTTPGKTGEDKSGSSKPAFSFATTASSQPKANGETADNSVVPSTPSTGFSFGGGNAPADSTSKASTEMMDTSPSSSNLFSGTANPSTPFGAPLGKPFSFGNGGNTNGTTFSAPSTSQGGFSFGSNTPSKPTASNSTPFVFGSNNNSSSTTNNGNVFGQPQGSSQPNNLFGNASTSQNGAFGGGALGSTDMAASNSQPGSSSSTPFAFGNSSNSGATNSMGGFGGFGQNQGQAMAASAPSKPAFTFGNTTSGNANPAPSTGTTNNATFSFNMPSAPNSVHSNSGFMSGSNNTAGNSPAPFVFGAGANTSSPAQANQSASGGGGFSFNMSAPASPQTPAGGNLFNLGAAPTAPASGNRPVRGMPSRRKR